MGDPGQSTGDRPSAEELCSSLETGAAAAAALGRYVAGLQEVSARRNEDGTDVHPTPAPISEVGLAASMPVPARTVGVTGPRIEFIDGGRVISIVEREVRIGRSTDNDIVVDDKAVSRYACVIMRGDTVILATGQHTYYLKELNSANGILLNSQQVSTSAQLHDNDVLTLGSTHLRFRVR